MTAFTKPRSLKAALKIGMFGPAGSGKTFSALLIAEGLARHTGKRIAFLDTEMGTAFYGQTVPQRSVHPQGFDFDVLHTRAITETLAAVRGLESSHYGVVIIDSISHLWDSCRNAYTGRQTKAGTIPLHAWTVIKRPYKELMHMLLSSPLHVILCGRQGIDYGEDEADHLGFPADANIVCVTDIQTSLQTTRLLAPRDLILYLEICDGGRELRMTLN